MVSQFLLVMAYLQLDPAHFTVDDVVVELYPGDAPLGGTPLAIEALKGDGNCLFRAASLLTHGDEDGHKLLRTKVIKEMEDNPDFYIDQFIEWAQKVIVIWAAISNCPIFAVTGIH